MRAIVTRTLPWTTHRPRRIVADAGPGCRRTQPWDRDDGRDGDDKTRHREAAEELCRVMDWPGRLEGGQLPGGDWAWVFVEPCRRCADREGLKAAWDRAAARS